jgi:hypothetical protein
VRTGLPENHLRGRPFEAMIFTGFGALWLILGLALRQQLSAAGVAWIAGAALTLAASGAQVLRHTESAPQAAENSKRKRIFHRINAGQWIAIFVVLTILHRMGLDNYGVTAIAGIVGLHLFPLAWLFHNPLHSVTGSLLIACAGGVAWHAPADALQSITALGMGAILWLSAAVTLALAHCALRRTLRLAGEPRIAA